MTRFRKQDVLQHSRLWGFQQERRWWHGRVWKEGCEHRVDWWDSGSRSLQERLTRKVQQPPQ